MGNFRGHAIPGTGFLLIGIPLLLRCYDVPFLRPYRFKRRIVLLEAWMKIIGGIIGIILEGGDMVYHEAYNSESHWDHLRILSLILLLGIVDLLHIFSFLKENFWVIVTPLGFSLIGFMFNLHQQESLASTFAHNVNAYLLYAGGLSRLIESMIGIHSNPQHHKMALTKIRNVKERSPKLDNKPTLPTTTASSTSNTRTHSCYSFWPFSLCFSPSRKTRSKQYPLNPIYTNPYPYKTIFPALTAILIILEGIWWWYMGVKFFWPSSNNHHHMVMKEHHAKMEVVGALYKMLLSTFAGAIVLNLLLHVIDRWCFLPRRNYKSPVDENGASYYQEETEDDDDHLELSNTEEDLEMKESPKSRLLRTTSA